MKILRSDSQNGHMVSVAQQNVLNILEEISIRIIHSEIIQHKALEAIKQPCIELIEQNIAGILYYKEITSSKSTYNNLLYLYAQWRDQTDPRTVMERYKDWEKDWNN